jgi:DNA-binding transcriptional LysR family regulator
MFTIIFIGITNGVYMNLKQLEVFLAVADTGSFSRGAEVTFITQSTVSQHISAMEREFGTRLLDRTGKGAFLTEGGKVLAEHARRVLREAREVEAAMSRFKGVEDVLLKAGGSNIPCSCMIPAALPVLFRRYPGLRISLVQGDSRETLTRLAAGEIEVGVVGSVFEGDGFSFSPLGADEISLIVPKGHRWAGRENLTRDELSAEPFIMRETGSGTGKFVREGLQGVGIDPDRLQVKAFLGSNEAIKRAVAGGAGVSFVSAMSVEEELERGELATAAVTGVQLLRRFYIAHREGRELSPAAVAFCGVLHELHPGNGIAT